MVGASAQLAAFGAADQYLSAQPQITYFKQIWRRYTQFAMEQIQQSWTGDADFGKRATVNLSRAGDLVTEVWLQVRLPDLGALNHIVGAARLATAPVIYEARSTAQHAMRVRAYTCGSALSYLASLLDEGGGVTSARLNAGNLGVTIVTADYVTSGLVYLVPQAGSGNTTIIALASADGLAHTSVALTPGVTYGVSLDGGLTTTPAMVRLQTVAAGADAVTFEVEGADPTAVYVARVSTALSGEPVASAAEHVLKAKWCNSVGHALVQSVEWEMGGTRIDRHTAEHWDMWCEVSEPEEKRAGYDDMIGRYDAYDINDDARSWGGSRYVFVPMRFSFNTSPGSALPLLALQFHDVKLNFEFRTFTELIKTNVPLTNLVAEPAMQCQVFATYVFLSQDERMRFANMPHEYLIEQVQAQVENVAAPSALDGVVNRKLTLNLSHPVKEIMFVYQAAANTLKHTRDGNNWFDYDIPGRETEEIFEEANIQMNGHDRFVKRPAKYWRLVVPWSHHSRIPAKKVHCYSFALHPESWQNPSGAANFSRIDTAHLSMTLNPNLQAGRIRIHGLGYNILRIANGLGGLVFAG